MEKDVLVFLPCLIHRLTWCLFLSLFLWFPGELNEIRSNPRNVSVSIVYRQLPKMPVKQKSVVAKLSRLNLVETFNTTLIESELQHEYCSWLILLQFALLLLLHIKLSLTFVGFYLPIALKCQNEIEWDFLTLVFVDYPFLNSAEFFSAQYLKMWKIWRTKFENAHFWSNKRRKA